MARQSVLRRDMAVVRRQEGVRWLSPIAVSGFSLAELRCGLRRSSELLSFGVARVGHHAAPFVPDENRASRRRGRRSRGCAPMRGITSTASASVIVELSVDGGVGIVFVLGQSLD